MREHSKKRNRAISWAILPKSIARFAGRIGLLPPSDPSQISYIIERSVASNTYNGLVSLERQGCIIDFHNLSQIAQDATLEVLKGTETGMKKLLRTIIINIP